MNFDESQRPSPAALPSCLVSLSPWVNELLPPIEELLTARDVARLTRRARWMVLSLTLLGRFPRKHRYHGRGVGWLRSDVLSWLSRDLRVLRCHTFLGLNARTRNARQELLPLGFARRPYTARRMVQSCMEFRNRSRRLRVRRSHAPESRET
jgi:predicted DNA-binding transcriptional regulator AlpA